LQCTLDGKVKNGKIKVLYSYWQVDKNSIK